MPVRLIKPYNGQAVNTLYWGSDEETLRAAGAADDRVELATDYQAASRVVTAATAGTSRNAFLYRMNSGSAQALTINQMESFPSGTVITVIQEGAGKTTLTPAAGVTINTAASTLLTAGQYSVAQLIKSGAGTWIAFGGLGG